MIRLSHMTIRVRLRALVAISTVGLAAVTILSALVLHQYRVEGPVHRELQLVRQLLTVMEPSVLAIWRPHLIVRDLPSQTDPELVSKRIEQLAELEAEYRDCYATWSDSELDPSLKKAVFVDCHQAAEAYFRAVNEELIPLVRSGEREKAKQILEQNIERKFVEYERRFTPALALARKSADTLRTNASDAAIFWVRVVWVLSISSIVLVGLIGWATVQSVTHATATLVDRVRGMASGASDLTVRLEIESRDELAELAVAVNAMIGKIQSVVQRVREASVQLLSTASQIAATAKHQESTVQGLSSATAEIAAAVKEISATGQEFANTMDEVNDRASQAGQLATSGRDGLVHIETTMKQLMDSTGSISAKLGVIREKSENISVVVTTITKVADQTNLLSINAAIEAEKAGEYGRGFLVVAREIRRLADQTAVATLDIENMVRLMQDAVSAGVMQMDKFAGEFRAGTQRVAEISGQTGQIIEEVEGLSERFKSVNEGMRSQSVASRQINDAMVPVASGTKETQASLEEFIKATSYLRQSVELVNQEIAQFKV